MNKEAIELRIRIYGAVSMFGSDTMTRRGAKKMLSFWENKLKETTQ